MQHFSTKDAEKLLPYFLSPVHPFFTYLKPLQQGEPPAVGKGDEAELNTSPVASVCFEMWAGLEKGGLRKQDSTTEIDIGHWDKPPAEELEGAKPCMPCAISWLVDVIRCQSVRIWVNTCAG